MFYITTCYVVQLYMISEACLKLNYYHVILLKGARSVVLTGHATYIKEIKTVRVNVSPAMLNKMANVFRVNVSILNGMAKNLSTRLSNIFMLKLTKYEIYPAHKCKNVNKR